MKLGSLILASYASAGFFKKNKGCPLLVDENAKADWPNNIGGITDIQSLLGEFHIIKSTKGSPFAQVAGDCPKVKFSYQEVDSVKVTYSAINEDRKISRIAKQLFQYDPEHVNALTLMDRTGYKLSETPISSDLFSGLFSKLSTMMDPIEESSSGLFSGLLSGIFPGKKTKDFRGKDPQQDFDNFVVVGYEEDGSKVRALVMACRSGFFSTTYDAMVLVNDPDDHGYDELLSDAEDTFRGFSKRSLEDTNFSDNDCDYNDDNDNYSELLLDPCNDLDNCVTLVENTGKKVRQGLKLKKLEDFTPEFQFDLDVKVKQNPFQAIKYMIFDINFDVSSPNQGTYGFFQTYDGMFGSFGINGFDSSNTLWEETSSSRHLDGDELKVVIRQRMMNWGNQLEVIINGEVVITKNFLIQEWSHDEIIMYFARGALAQSTIKNFTYRKLEGLNDL